MSSRLINRSINPWIHIDWSCINSKTKMYLLRASISVKGRAIVIYEECHHKEKDNNHATHKQFLNNLKEILPTYSIPIIITDAGFRAPWFKVIQQMGWHFVGRVRNKNVVLFDESDNWQYTSSFFKKAKPKPSYLGRALLTLRQQVEVHIVTYRGKSKNRHSCNINKQRRTSSKELHYSKAAKEPWVLVTSLPNSCKDPKHIVNIYRQRMRIEENFRDTKCNYYGLGLKVSLTRTQCRMEILLLVAAIATFAAWLSGVIVIDRNQASDYQAHSARFTRVLSTVYLGREAIKKGLQISVPDFYKSLKLLLQMVINTQMEQGVDG